MSPEPFPTHGQEYRLSNALALGVVTTLFFSFMGILSVAVALLNTDGSFPHPVAFAVTFGVFWSCLALLGVGLILAHVRHRLFVDSAIVHVTDCFTARQIQLANVTRAVWKSFLKEGGLILYDKTTRVKIAFGNYTFQERSELIRFFRTALADRSQEGWESFESRCMPPQVDYQEVRSQIHGLLRFTAIAWATAIPPMYAILIGLKLADGLPNGNWFVVAILPLVIAGAFLGILWLAARGDLARARDRQDSG